MRACCVSGLDMEKKEFIKTFGDYRRDCDGSLSIFFCLIDRFFSRRFGFFFLLARGFLLKCFVFFCLFLVLLDVEYPFLLSCFFMVYDAFPRIKSVAIFLSYIDCRT
jgi:hypothetical protein